MQPGNRMGRVTVYNGVSMSDILEDFVAAYEDRFNDLEKTVGRLDEKMCDIEQLKCDIKKTTVSIEKNNDSLGNIRESIIGINSFMTNIDTMFIFIKDKVAAIENIPVEYIKTIKSDIKSEAKANFEN